MNLVDHVTAPERAALKLFGSDLQYLAHGAMAPAVIRGFTKGIRTEQQWGAFFEGDLQLTVDSNQFQIVVGHQTPRRFDRVILNGDRSFTVQDWKGSPEQQWVFFRMLIRGDSQ